ncbi:MAG: hypothetical protein ACTSVM_01425 [Candidatus Ranarchaeia archaeon]
MRYHSYGPWTLLVVIIEAAIEPIPDIVLDNITKQKPICKKPDKPRPLLDVSLHHQWMYGLKDREKRGRPDIVHRILLGLTDSPLALAGKLDVLIQTYDGTLIWIKKGTRPPRSYKRFCGLFSSILEGNAVIDSARVFEQIRSGESNSGARLCKLKERLQDFLDVWNPSWIGLLASEGTNIGLMHLAKKITNEQRPVLLLGGFQKGRLSEKSHAFADAVYRIYSSSLSASAVICRILCAVEITLGLDLFNLY